MQEGKQQDNIDFEARYQIQSVPFYYKSFSQPDLEITSMYSTVIKNIYDK